MQSIVYLHVGGNDYRLVGIADGEKFIGYKSTKEFFVKIGQFVRDNWGIYPTLDNLFFAEYSQSEQKRRNFKSRLQFNPKTEAAGLRALFNLGIKVVIPKQCKVFKAEERREMEKIGFEMIYAIENAKLTEKASFTLDTMRGWATYFTLLCAEREIFAETKSKGDFQIFALPIFEKVIWQAVVTNLEDARAVHMWTAEQAEQQNIHLAVLEWANNGTAAMHKSVIAKIPLGQRLWVCFLNSDSLKGKGFSLEQIVGQAWRIKITPPTTGKKAGMFWLIDQIKFAGA